MEQLDWWSNGVLMYNNQQSSSYEDKGVWIVNETGAAPTTDSYGGKSSLTGNYYHTANPIGLRRQRETISLQLEHILKTRLHTLRFLDGHSMALLFMVHMDTLMHTLRHPLSRELNQVMLKELLLLETFYLDGTILQSDEVGPPVDSVEFIVLNFVSFTGSTDIFTSSQICTQVTSDTDDTTVTGVNGIVILMILSIENYFFLQ